MLGSQYSTVGIYKAIRYGQTNIPKGKVKGDASDFDAWLPPYGRDRTHNLS